MLKGIQKNMIWVRTPESALFESAYFVLRPKRSTLSPDDGEMVREANRLVFEGDRPGPRRQTAKRRARRSFLFGLLCGLLGACLLGFLLLLWR